MAVFLHKWKRFCLNTTKYIYSYFVLVHHTSFISLLTKMASFNLAGDVISDVMLSKNRNNASFLSVPNPDLFRTLFHFLADNDRHQYLHRNQQCQLSNIYKTRLQQSARAYGV